MRELASPPDALIDPRTRAPRFGSFRGALPAVDLDGMGRGRLFRLAHEKRWVYFAIASDELFVGIAIAHLGYLVSCFAFAFDRTERRMIADRSALGPPFAGTVGDRAGEGCIARYRLGGTSFGVVRRAGSATYAIDVDAKDLHVHASVGAAGAPPPIGVVAPIDGGLVNATEKRALLEASGEARVAGKRYSLDGALAGYDYTHGYLARRTAWRWAFALGRTRAGERVGLNLVEGFVGEPECALWLGDELVPLAEGRFELDRRAPLSPWRVRTADGAVDLEFSPGGMHAEHKNLGLVASRFVQPAGTYRGTIRLPGRGQLDLDDVLGVTEDQDVLW